MGFGDDLTGGGGQGALTGAAGGAMTGAAFGSVVPGLGTALGAGIGGVVGGIGGWLDGAGRNSEKERLEQERQRYLESIRNRQAPELGPASTAGYSDFRGNQQNLIRQLEAMARGEGPSVSREMLNQATNRNIAAQSSMAAGGRGNSALNAMVAANNTSRLGADAAQSAALGRVQEQQGAINNLGMQIYSGRNADEDTNRFNASQRNQMAQAQGQLRNQYYGIQDNANLSAMGYAPRPSGGPSFGDQMLAGGGNALAFVNAQKANARG